MAAAAALAPLAALVAALVAARPTRAQEFSKAEEERRINEARPIMEEWSKALGVKCEHCHVAKGGLEGYLQENPNRAVAKQCLELFVKKLKTAENEPVKCSTCHRGMVEVFDR
jgi:hypothetical protein